jgi:hypothetical protein
MAASASVVPPADQVAPTANVAPLPPLPSHPPCAPKEVGEPLALIRVAGRPTSDVVQIHAIEAQLAKLTTATPCPTCVLRTSCDVVRDDGRIFSALCRGPSASKDPRRGFGFWPLTRIRRPRGYEPIDLPAVMGVSSIVDAVAMFDARAKARDPHDVGVEEDQLIGLLIDATSFEAVEAAPGKVYLPAKSPLPFPAALALRDGECDPYALAENVGEDQPGASGHSLGFGFDGDPEWNGRPRFTSATRPASARTITREIDGELAPFSSMGDQVSCEIATVTPRLVSVACPRYGNRGLSGVLAFDYALGETAPKRLRGKDVFAPNAQQRIAIAKKCFGPSTLPRGDLPAALTKLPELTNEDLDLFEVADGKVKVFIPFTDAIPTFAPCDLGLDEIGASPELRSAMK